MKKILATILFASFALFIQPALRAEEKPADGNAVAKTARAADSTKAATTEPLEEALAHKISCEFVDTPIKEVLAFLQTLKKINLIISTPAQSVNTPINLRVADMPAGDVLKYVCKLANLSVEIQDQAIYIATLNEDLENVVPKKETPPVPTGTKLRIKLSNGNEFEADGAIFNNKPELLDKLVDRFLQDEKK